MLSAYVQLPDLREVRYLLYLPTNAVFAEGIVPVTTALASFSILALDWSNVVSHYCRASKGSSCEGQRFSCSYGLALDFLGLELRRGGGSSQARCLRCPSGNTYHR